jgi:hypothetical protein
VYAFVEARTVGRARASSLPSWGMALHICHGEGRAASKMPTAATMEAQEF